MKRTTRRDRGSGGVRQRKNGTWEGRVRHGVGRPTTYVYGATKHIVLEKIRTEMARPLAEGADSRLSAGEWLDRWLQSVKEDPNLRPATYNIYKNAVRLHIKPSIENIKLEKLSKVNIYNMLDRLASEKVGDRTRQVVYSTLHRALQIALKRDMVIRNVVALVDKPSAKKKTKIILRTAEEFQAFRNAVSESDYKALFLTALDTGLRLGELTALRWDCLDIPRGLLHVKATLTVDHDKKLVASEPKTASSVRTVKLAKHTTELLRQHQKDQMGSDQGLASWVFPNTDGGPLRKDGLLRIELARVAKVAGVPGLTFHGLRHSHATMLATLGVGVKVTQERLGHSTSRMTLDVYTHATTAMQDTAVAALDALHDSESSISGTISGTDPKMADAAKNENPQSLAG
jgi:integrase